MIGRRLGSSGGVGIPGMPARREPIGGGGPPRTPDVGGMIGGVAPSPGGSGGGGGGGGSRNRQGPVPRFGHAAALLALETRQPCSETSELARVRELHLSNAFLDLNRWHRPAHEERRPRLYVFSLCYFRSRHQRWTRHDNRVFLIRARTGRSEHARCSSIRGAASTTSLFLRRGVPVHNALEVE
jgi:hypothetical protein